MLKLPPELKDKVILEVKVKNHLNRKIVSQATGYAVAFYKPIHKIALLNNGEVFYYHHGNAKAELVACKFIKKIPCFCLILSKLFDNYTQFYNKLTLKTYEDVVDLKNLPKIDWQYRVLKFFSSETIIDIPNSNIYLKK